MRRKIVIRRIIIGFSLIACICQAQNSQAPSCGQNHFTRPDDPRRIAAGGGDGLSGANSDNNGAQLGAWPWMVSAGYKLTGAEPWEHVCGGSLVSDRHVLTSAHCTIDSRLQLRLGDSNLASPLDDLGAKVRTISRTVLHPSYAAGSRSAYYDLAVWEFRPPLNTFNDYISPVCLPDQASRDQNKNEGSHVSVVGWGLRARNDPNRDALLRHAPIRIFSQEWCNITHSGSLPLNIQEAVRALVPDLFQSNVMCAGSDYGVYGSCKGDSGSPLIRLYTTNGRPRYVQLGLVQGGVGRCGDTRYPSIYVRLDDPEVLDFVQETIGLKKTRPPENSLPTSVDHDKQNSEGKTRLFIASQLGLLSEVQDLLLKGANPNIQENIGRTPLMTAAINDHLDVARLLVQSGADITLTDNEGRTAFFIACLTKHLSVAKMLGDWGANINHQDSYLDTPILNAAADNIRDIAEYLVSRGAKLDIQNQHGKAALHYTCWHGHLEMTQLLVENGADINLTDFQGETPLIDAISHGNPEIALYLLNQDPDIHVRNTHGRTAMHYACMNSTADVARALVDKGADLTIKGRWGQTPFSVACGFGNLDVARYMMSNGLEDMGTRDRNGATPLWLAANHGHYKVVQLLLFYGGSQQINAPDNDGLMPLHAAAKKGWVEVVKLLLTNGANKSWRTNDGKTAKDLALSNGHSDVADLL